jgi:hypothetical protein
MKNLFVKAMPHTSRNFLTIVLAFGLVVSALYGSAAHASATTVPSARFGGPFSSHGTSLSGPFTGHGSSQHPPQGSLVRQPLEPNQAAYLQAKARLNAHVPRGSVSRQGLSQGVVPPVPVSFKGLVRMVAVRLLIPPGRWERSGTSSWSIRSTALVNWVKSARILR